jgi:hypothetical protein
MESYFSAQKAILERRQRLQDALQSLEFEKWTHNLSGEEKVRITRMATSERLKAGMLHDHFEREVWPGRAREIQSKERHQSREVEAP